MVNQKARSRQNERGPFTEDLCTVAEAAEMLGVSASTIWRWIDAHKLPASRVGPRAIRIKRSDVRAAVQPVSNSNSNNEVTRMGDKIYTDVREATQPLTEAEQARWHSALADADKFRAKMRAKRHGKPFSDSAEIIREAREERSRQL